MHMVNIAFAKCLKAKEGFSAYEQKERRERWSEMEQESEGDRQTERSREKRERKGLAGEWGRVCFVFYG